MYTPESFRVAAPSAIYNFIRQYSFGLLLTTERGRIHETHTPFVVSDDEGHLYGHMAKANPQWRNWTSTSIATVVFTGPHAYISPSYYTSEFNVPTWNYTAVTVRGPISIVDERERVVTIVDSLVSQYERHKATPWELDASDPRYMQLLSSIVAFSLEVVEVEASFKLSQNKRLEDQQSVVRHLRQSRRPMDDQVATLMQQNIESH